MKTSTHLRTLAATLLLLTTGGCGLNPWQGESDTQAPVASEAKDEKIDVASQLAAAWRQIEQKDWPGAEAALLKARSAEPDNPWVALNLGVVYQNTGRREEARHEYRQVIGTAPADLKAAQASDARHGQRGIVDIARHNLRTLGLEPAAKPQPASAAPQVLAAAITPTRVAPVAPPPNDPDTVHQLLDKWMKAWTARDIDAYLACYVSGHQGDKKTPKAWQAERRRIITSAGTIDLEFSDIVIKAGSAQATVTFRQVYRSDRMQDAGNKTLTLERGVSGQWRIAQEKFEPIH